MEKHAPNAWAKSFEGKSEADIWRVMPPSDLPAGELAKFKNAQSDAAAIARTAEQAGKLKSLEADLAKTAKQIGYDRGAQQEPQPNDETRGASALPRLVIPTGPVDTLLEKQIAACAGLIEQVAFYIAHDTTPPDACVNFMDRIASLMNSSATVGKMIGHLRGLQPEETRHRMIVEHAGP